MCNITLIASLIATGSIALIAAVVAFAVAVINAGSFWLAFGNAIAMGIAIAAEVVALGSVNAAAVLVPACSIGACKTTANTIFTALVSLGTALAVLLTATIVGIVPSMVPFAGVAVPIALAVAAGVCAITLGVIAKNLLLLNFCVSLPVPGPTQTTIVMIASIAAAIAALATVLVGGAVGAHTLL